MKCQCMDSSMIISKTNIATNQDYYSQKLAKIKTDNVYDNFSKNKICLTLKLFC